MKNRLIPLLLSGLLTTLFVVVPLALEASKASVISKKPIFKHDLQVIADCNPQLTVALDDMGGYTLTAEEVNLNSSSDQGEIALSIDIVSLSCADLGTPVIVTLTVEDAIGDSDTCTSEVTVIDNTAPVLECSDEIVNVGDGSVQTLSPSDFLISTTDNCSQIIDAVFLDPFSGWVEEQSASTANLQDVYFTDLNNGWIVGNLGNIQHTSNGGQTWLNQSSGTNQELRSVYFTDSNNGWAVGLNETIIATNDGGNTWTAQNAGLGIGANFYSVFFLDANNGFIGGSDAVLLQTTDGGTTWTDLNINLLESKRDIFFSDPNNGWIISQDSILNTTDGGQSWNSQASGVSNALRKLNFVDASIGWIVGDNGLILNTVDGGDTWQTQNSGTTISSLKDINMYSATSGYISGGNGTLLYTSDAGLTWSPVTLPNTPSADFRGLSALDEQEITIVGFSNVIYSYFDGTLNAETLDFDCSDYGLQDISISVSDEQGNTSTCDVVLNVVDDESPVASCMTAVVELDDTGNYTFDGTEIDGGSLDLCTQISFSTIPANVDCTMLGIESVELVVEDERGNTASCTTTVEILDNTLPTALCSDFDVDLDNGGSYTLNAVDVDGGSSDNCPGWTLTITEGLIAFDCTNIGTPELVELTVEDPSGNLSTCDASVTVNDGTAPEIECIDFIAEIGNSGIHILQPVDVLQLVTDNCTGTPSINFSQEQFDCSHEGTTIVVDVTVADDAGNSSTCQSNVSIVDSVDPVMDCQNISIALDASGTAEVIAEDVVLSVTDECEFGQVLPASVLFDCTTQGINTVEFSVSDNAGNEQTCTVEISVEDDTNPIVTCIQSLDVILDAAGNASIEVLDVLDTSTDNCQAEELSFLLDLTSFDCTDAGSSIPVQLTASDASGNEGTCTTIVTVVDDELPIVECQDVTLDLDAGGTASAVVDDFIASSSDNCDLSFSASPLTFTCEDSGTGVNVVAFDGTNLSSCIATVTLVDNTPPSITCQDFDAFIIDSNGYEFDENDALLTAEDNCGIVEYLVSISIFECDQVGSTIEVILTAVDEAGLTDECLVNVSLFEEVAPVIECQDFDLILDDDGVGLLTSEDVLVSAFDNCGLIEESLSNDTFDCSNLGDNSVTITVSDQFDNETTCVVNVNVIDQSAPEISCLESITVNLDAVLGTVNIDENDLLDEQDDNCAISSISLSQNNFNCLDETVDVTVTAMDASQNIATCVSSVIVTDITPPSIVCQNFILEMPASGFAGITESDVISSVSDNCIGYDIEFSTEFFDCSSLGTVEVTVFATDNSENTSTCSSFVTIVDLIEPEALCQELVVTLDQNGLAGVVSTDIDAGSADNCDELVYILSQAIFSCDNLGVNDVTLTVIDGSGLQDACTTTVTVTDEQVPTANCLQVYELSLDSDGSAELLIEDIDNGSFDNCDIVSQTLSQTSFDCDSNSPQLVSLSLEDQSGNINSCNTLVSIVDEISPELECISEVLIVELEPTGLASIQETDVVIANTDNCEVDDLVISQTNFDCNDIGALIEISINSEDQAGNTSFCTVMIDVQDNIDPVFSCQDIEVTLNDQGLVFVEPEDIILGSIFEPCGLNEVSLDVTSFNCENIGQNDVIISVSDVNGNFEFCFAKVTVSDVTGPVVECQNTEINLDFDGEGSIEFEDVFISSFDNCAVESTVLSQNTFDCEHLGETAIQIISTDIHGNEGICTAIVTVNDNISPAVFCDNSISVEIDANCSYVVEDFMFDLEVLDNCSIEGEFTIQQNPAVGTILEGAGFNDLIFIVEDASGNESQCVTNLILQDNIAPTIVCNDLELELDEEGLLTLPLNLIGDGSFDNCNTELLFSTTAPLNYSCADVGAWSIELTIMDASELTATCTANIQIVDNTAPVVTCSPFTIYLDEDGLGELDEQNLNTVLNTIDEACDLESISFSYTEVDCDDLGSNPLDIIALDEHGNQGVCSTTLFVEDTIAPFLICTSLDVNLGPDGTGILEANDIILITNDECGIGNSTVSESFFTCDDIGPHIIQVSVFDNFGNESSCEVEIDVEDQAPPVIECSSLITELPENGIYNLQLEEVLISAEDVCSDMITFDYGPNIFDCDNIGFNTVLISAMDEYGNLSSCVVDVVIQDNQSPEAICNDLTVDLDETGNAIVDASQYASGSIDNCFNIIFTPSVINLNCSNVGENNFEIMVTDPMGQFDFCNSTITVNENLAPVLNLQDTLVVVLDAGGNALVNVNDFDLGTSDNCGFFNLTYDANQQFVDLSFNCDDEGFNLLTVWATDSRGNQSMGTVVLEIIKSGACDPTVEEVILGGNIFREDELAIPDVTVDLSNGTSQLTNTEGAYSFVVLADSSYTIIPSRDGGFNNGVSTFDIALIQSVILGLSSFDSPYKYIAADVNNSGNISTFDILLLQRLILGLDTEFSNNTSWRFVDANYTFPDPLDPWFGGPFPEQIELQNINADSTGLDFVAVKIGDVNLTSSPFGGSEVISSRGSDQIKVHAKDKQFVANELVQVRLSQDDIDFVAGQFEVSFDASKLELTAVGGSHLNHGSYLVDENRGIVSVSFLDFDNSDSSQLIELSFRSLEDGLLSDVLSIEEERLTSELISRDMDLYNLELVFSELEQVGLRLGQVWPNPFVDQVRIGFELLEEDEVEMVVRDQSGLIIREMKSSFSSGEQYFLLEGIESSGLLLFELKSSKGNIFGKLIKH